MKRSLSYILLTATLAFTAPSCRKDFLETKPFTSIDAASAFSSGERVTAAMTGLYDLITVSTFNTQIVLTSEIKGGDMLVISAGNYSRFVTEYQYVQTPALGYGGGFFSGAWKLIVNTNVAITELPKSPISDADKDDYLAEARALRAWGHLTLARLFAKPYSLDKESPGIPFLDRVLGPSEAIPPRGTVAETYAKITEDLVWARDHISATKRPVAKAANGYGRITKAAINGLLARVYQDQEMWPESVAAAKAALGTDYTTLPAGSTLLAGFIDPTDEWIWTLKYRSDDNTGYVQIASFQEPYNIGYSTFRATPSFFNLFAANDIRQKQFFVNEEMVATLEGDALQRDAPMIAQGGYLMNKFWFRDAWDLNVPMMRAAEMYLIIAEGEAEQTHDGLAQDALFVVQARSITGAVKSTNTGAALKTEIRNERRKELYGEGFRLYDIARKKETLIRTSPEHWVPITLQPGDTRLVLPIPQAERDVSGFPQNDGYL